MANCVEGDLVLNDDHKTSLREVLRQCYQALGQSKYTPPDDPLLPHLQMFLTDLLQPQGQEDPTDAQLDACRHPRHFDVYSGLMLGRDMAWGHVSARNTIWPCKSIAHMTLNLNRHTLREWVQLYGSVTRARVMTCPEQRTFVFLGVDVPGYADGHECLVYLDGNNNTQHRRPNESRVIA
jgi:hypothetical protein